jgi:hypothetical protein
MSTQFTYQQMYFKFGILNLKNFMIIMILRKHYGIP